MDGLSKALWYVPSVGGLLLRWFQIGRIPNWNQNRRKYSRTGLMRLSSAVNEHAALLHLCNIVQLKPMGTISYEEMAFHVSRLQIESGRKLSCGGWLAFHITRLFAQRDG
jgi:hypothetical protein